MTKREFEDGFGDPAEELNLSDADLDALMAGSLAASSDDRDHDALTPGDRIEGPVTGIRDGEIWVEIGRKTHGVIDLSEFGGEPPEIGSTVSAHVERYDREREIVLLTAKEARQELFWDSVEVGDIYEGIAIEPNKGGLTLDIRGERAFLPISQIERGRVEDPAPFVGQRFQCEVISVDRESRDLVVSRRVILQREREENRLEAAAQLRVGDVIAGEVVRLNEHGAFVSLGPLEGLLHASKIRNQRELGESLKEGQRLEVEIVHLDLERGRVGLDFKSVRDDPWTQLTEEYAEGDSATGLVTRVTDEGAYVQIDEQVEGFLPAGVLRETPSRIEKGTLLRVSIKSIDRDAGRLELTVE